jgi:hypothetical protein
VSQQCLFKTVDNHENSFIRFNFFVIGIWCSQIPFSQNETSILLRTLRQSDQVGLNSLKLSQIGAAARAAYVLCKFSFKLWLHNYFNKINVFKTIK